MKLYISTLLTLAVPIYASAHHSRAGYDMNGVQEIEGELVSIIWRNPHIGFTVRVATEGEEDEPGRRRSGTARRSH